MFKQLAIVAAIAVAVQVAGPIAPLHAASLAKAGTAGLDHHIARANKRGRAARSAVPRFERGEAVLAFISAYREDKRPEHVPAAVKAMVEHGLLREPEEAGIYIGFIAGVLSENAASAEKLVTAMFPMPPDTQVVLIKAIAYSGLPDWQGLLARLVERMPARKVLLERYLYRAEPYLLDKLMTAETGAFAIDVHWGRYFATGDAAPARAIITVLGWTADRDSVEKLTIGSMAKWTLASNAAKDPGLVRIMTAEVNTQPDDVRKPLREVIIAAETLETSRIRKDAMKAIEELKAKGPKSARDTVWWGQAGQTVLALGCVAAAAVGQVEFGIPCVIGGAVSSAALKYLVPQ